MKLVQQLLLVFSFMEKNELCHLFFVHTTGEADGMNGFYRLFVADRRVVVGFASALDDLYGLAAFGCSS